MPKVETEIAAAIVKRRVTSPEEQTQVLDDLKKVLEQEAAEKEMKPPTLKKEFVFIISDPKNALAAAYPDGIVGWVVQIEEGEAPQSALTKLHAAAYEHNASPKGRKFPVETVGEACETVKAKFFKDAGVWVKTKEAVLVVATDNKIPKAPGLPD
jgi:hypothetical protein